MNDKHFEAYTWIDEDIMRVVNRLDLELDDVIHVLKLQLDSWEKTKEDSDKDEARFA